MRWFFMISVVLHAFVFIGLAMYLRPGSGALSSPFAESLPTSTTHPAMGSLPTLEVKPNREGVTPASSAARERIEFEIVNTDVRPATLRASESEPTATKAEKVTAKTPKAETVTTQKPRLKAVGSLGGPSVIGNAKVPPAGRPDADPKPASGFKLKQVDGYQITIAPSFTGAPSEKNVKPDAQAAERAEVQATAPAGALPAKPDAPTPPGFVPAAQTQDEQ